MSQVSANRTAYPAGQTQSHIFLASLFSRLSISVDCWFLFEQARLRDRGVEVVEYAFLTPEAVAEYCYERGFLQVIPCSQLLLSHHRQSDCLGTLFCSLPV